MSKPEYASLHAHFHQSILDGFSTVPEYLAAAKEQGMRAHGSSDHGNEYNAYEFIKAARKADIIPVPGIEMYMAPLNPEGAKVKKPVYYGKTTTNKKGSVVPVSPGNDVSSSGAYTHMTMWAVSNEGLKNLFALSSMSFHPDNTYSKNRIDLGMLAEHSEGIVAATGCPSSEVSTRFRLGQDKEAYEYAGRLKEIFGDRLFVEVMNHNMGISLERDLLPKQQKLARDLGIPLLATNDTHYARKEEAPNHEEFLCIQSGSRMSEPTFSQGGSRFAFDGAEYYVKSAEQMAELFPESDFPSALKNSLVIAEMAQDISLDFDPRLRPRPILPPGFDNEVAYLQHLINVGFKERYGKATREVKDEALRRIAYEFEVIRSSDFVGYMLTVYEYLNWTRENYSTRDTNGDLLALSIGPGRGSVGGSIMAYVLKISEVDPVRFDLVFERFLSPGRGATYRVEYEDGTFEDIVVSEQKDVIRPDGSTDKSYIHQLNPGDEVVF